MRPSDEPPEDLYALLQTPRDAPPAEIKRAYHRTLLRLHPDKRARPRHRAGESDAAPPPAAADDDPGPRRPQPDGEASVDVASLREAYATLSDVRRRAAYDGVLRRRDAHARSSAGPPRPAQAVSLEEFAAVEATRGAKTGSDADAVVEEWQYPCRCGGAYRLTEGDLENGTHLVGCSNCSEVIWVGYEVVSEDEER